MTRTEVGHYNGALILSESKILSVIVHFFVNSQLISRNQERFIAMLNEPITEDESQQETTAFSPPEGGSSGQAGSGVNYIRVTPQEKEAIERVSRWFFDLLQLWSSSF